MCYLSLPAAVLGRPGQNSIQRTLVLSAAVVSATPTMVRMAAMAALTAPWPKAPPYT